MPRTIDELLASVDAELALMDDALPAPATEADIAQATRWITEHYGAKTPTGLENFWRDHNGLDFNGRVIFSARHTGQIDDVAEVSVLYTQDWPDHVMIGQADDVYLFVWRPSSGRFEYLGVGDFDGGPDQSFATFEEFLTNVLEEAAA